MEVYRIHKVSNRSYKNFNKETVRINEKLSLPFNVGVSLKQDDIAVLSKIIILERTERQSEVNRSGV